ncbi:MAG: DAK2 domain-containing protein, partial [Candidatus Limnocylindrus sp.]
HAYAAVAVPTEGTILTVAREAASAAMQDAESGPELRPFLERIAGIARTSVEKTPNLLAVLREAGVVDSGGAGLQLILEGIANVPSVAPSPGGDETTPMSRATTAGLSAPVPHHADAESGAFGYETVFILSATATPLDLGAIRTGLEALGESVLVAGDGQVCKVHVHNQRPDLVLAYGIERGNVRAVTIENLDQQSSERATGHEAFAALAASRTTAGVSAERSAQVGTPTLQKKTAIVAVAAGDGLGVIMRGLGAEGIVHGGQTENPSTADIAAAIDATACSAVVVLPNNSNIVLAARQAAEICAADVIIVPTRNAAEGIAALLAWDPGLPLADLVARMESARTAARTFRIVEAVRDAVVGGVKVRAGEMMALNPIDGIIATGATDTEALSRALALQPAELITLYAGADLDSSATDLLVAAARAAAPTAEIDLQRGGQPIERVLVGLE